MVFMFPDVDYVINVYCLEIGPEGYFQVFGVDGIVMLEYKGLDHQ